MSLNITKEGKSRIIKCLFLLPDEHNYIIVFVGNKNKYMVDKYISGRCHLS
jgi:hypothetical protein